MWLKEHGPLAILDSPIRLKKVLIPYPQKYLGSNKKKYEQYEGLVTTDHNPCLWTNISYESKPWRNVYNKALEYLNDWKENKINDTELLHSLRYVAYGYNNEGDDKRNYDDEEVIWYGNLTIKHKLL